MENIEKTIKKEEERKIAEDASNSVEVKSTGIHANKDYYFEENACHWCGRRSVGFECDMCNNGYD